MNNRTRIHWGKEVEDKESNQDSLRQRIVATTARAATERARHAAWKASARRRARHRGGGEGREGGRGTAHRTQGHGSPFVSRPGRAPTATAHGGGAGHRTQGEAHGSPPGSRPRRTPTTESHGGPGRGAAWCTPDHPGRPRRAADRAPWTLAVEELGRGGGGVAARGGRRRGRGAAELAAAGGAAGATRDLGTTICFIDL